MLRANSRQTSSKKRWVYARHTASGRSLSVSTQKPSYLFRLVPCWSTLRWRKSRRLYILESTFLPLRFTRKYPMARLPRRSTPSQPQYSPLEKRNLLASLADAGVLQRTIDYVNNLESDWTDIVLSDVATQNAIEKIVSTREAPADATLITSEAQFSQIVSGGTYLIRGDLTVTNTFAVPSDVTIYVDGSIFKQGSVTSSGTVHSIENLDDAIFYIQNTDNVNIYGIDNALLHSDPDLSVTTPHASAIIIRGNSNNIHVEGFEIANVWEGLVSHFGASNVTFESNHVHDIVGRAIWVLGNEDSFVVHNIVENPGMDGIDFDAFTEDSYAFENVVFGAGRWAGFVEEGANNNYFVSLGGQRYINQLCQQQSGFVYPGQPFH